MLFGAQPKLNDETQFIYWIKNKNEQLENIPILECDFHNNVVQICSHLIDASSTWQQVESTSDCQISAYGMTVPNISLHISTSLLHFPDISFSKTAFKDGLDSNCAFSRIFGPQQHPPYNPECEPCPAENGPKHGNK